ncbi:MULTISPECIES: phosphoribosyl-ATP diphosphatase [unclassified Rhizobium]|jgi:phosphoribosyl-ATP pyrophosphohydrolase|uniref:phosphoribosyl-ATP diphosphatase n=1 Tax=unclassified Rhizobium TaxID=2613769 RepID=UPI000B0B5D27|nr:MULTISPECIES: phosphoribosyl-ATP diphosphatase [unclassified Rhizobium]RKD36024.1 phosphoribosyl-ATP pyrophosphatase [Rhizobium sp. WW_1]
MNAILTLRPATSATHASACPAASPVPALDQLYDALDHVTSKQNPRTAHLMQSSLRKLSQKVVEEAAEVALEAVRKRTDTTVSESVDLLYHLVVLWHRLGIRPEDVWAEMQRRSAVTGITGKLPKKGGAIASCDSRSRADYRGLGEHDIASKTNPTRSEKK